MEDEVTMPNTQNQQLATRRDRAQHRSDGQGFSADALATACKSVVCAAVLAVMGTGWAQAGELSLVGFAGYTISDDLGFVQNEPAAAVGGMASWSPDGRWSLEGMMIQRYADKSGAGDSISQTLTGTLCWYTDTGDAFRLCGGIYSTSLTTESWAKAGGGLLVSVGHRWEVRDGDVELTAAYSPSTNVDPEVSALAFRAYYLPKDSVGWIVWSQRLSPVGDSSIPGPGWEVGGALAWRVGGRR